MQDISIKRVEHVIDLWIEDFLKNPDAITSFVVNHLKYIKEYSGKSEEDILGLDVMKLDIPDIKAVMLHRNYKDSAMLQRFVRSFYRYLCTGSI